MYAERGGAAVCPSKIGAMTAPALPVTEYLDGLYQRHKLNRAGKLADYIPELARVEADQFGLAFATIDGFIYEVGDTTVRFTIQSISKAIIYGLALEDHGREGVLRKIGVEPSGEAFNSIVFDERNNRPFNPMVNAGAIAATALVKGADHAERLARILDVFQRFAGRDLTIDEAVYRSESATGHRNRAIAFLELNSGMIDGNVEEHLDLYFRQCSLLVNTGDLAIIGATLANSGVNPLTGERALRSENVRSVLSVMNTCGMYDYAGGWQVDVGLPAKSGVGGGIAAVLPGHLGIGVFSPRLDSFGNSERGVKVCEDISRNFHLHQFEDRRQGQDPVRRFYRGSEVRSSRMRRPSEVSALDHDGYAIAVCELQGDLSFVEAERLSRRIGAELPSLRYLIVDMTRVRRVHPIAEQILGMLRASLKENEHAIAVVNTDLRRTAFSGANGFPTVDAALEYFEDILLAQVLAPDAAPLQSVPLEDFVLLAAWPTTNLAALERHLTPRPFRLGDVLIEAGTAARALYFLTSGRVSVSINVGNGTSRRISTIDAGNVFGELALFGHARRTADVVAASDGLALELRTEDIAAISADMPQVEVALALAIGRSLADRLGRANREIQALAR